MRYHGGITAAFLALVAVAVLADKLPAMVFGLYLGASSVSFIAYALDKSAARNNGWRTRESTLHVFAVAGGWPGALLAQQVFRHKTKKRSFRTLFWMTVVVNCGALGLLLSPLGSSALRAIPGSP